MDLISTNELFHFTKFEYLKSIISNKSLYPRFNLEFTHLGKDFYKKGTLFPIPMVCFCDIPLKNSEDHRKRYGNCAIVLREKWKIEKKLNPVFYVQSESYPAKILANISNSVESFLPIIKKNQNDLSLKLSEVRNNFMTLVAFIKQFENKREVNVRLDNETGKFEKRRFYDEKEWRYIPEFSENKKELEISISDFNNEEKKEMANKKLEKHKLNFEASDVEYLIVNSTQEKIELERIINKDYECNIEIKIM